MIYSPLREVCDISMGQAPPGNSYNTGGHGLPLLAGAGDFGNLYPSPKKFTTNPTRVSKQNDIILCIRATIGDLNMSDREYCLGRGVAGLRPKPTRLDRQYLWHWLSISGANLEKYARGSTFKQVSRDAIESLRIPVPSLLEQRRIATVLDKADAICRKRQQAIQLTEELLQSAYMYLVGPANPDYQSWPVHKVEKLADPTPGSIRSGPFGSHLRHSEFVNDGIAVLGIDNAVQNRFVWAEKRFIAEEKYRELNRYTVRPSDVIITIMGTTGRSAVVPSNIPVAITTKHLATISVNRSLVLPEFLSNAIHRDPIVLAQIRVANRGAIMAGLNLGIIKDLKLHCPPLQNQETFSKFVNAVGINQDKYLESKYAMNRLFAALSQRAFSGKL